MGLFGGGSAKIHNAGENRISDLSITRCEFGTKVPEIFGTIRT